MRWGTVSSLILLLQNNSRRNSEDFLNIPLPLHLSLGFLLLEGKKELQCEHERKIHTTKYFVHWPEFLFVQLSIDENILQAAGALMFTDKGYEKVAAERI